MKVSLRSTAVLAVFIVALFVPGQESVVLSATHVRKPLPTQAQVPGEVLVKFRTSLHPQQRFSAAQLRRHAVVADIAPSGWLQLRIPPSQTIAEALAAYQNDPDVELAQPNFIYYAAAMPNDVHYPQLWAFRNSGQTVTGPYLPNTGTPGADINIERVWDHITDCSSVVVAVLDSGVNYSQQDLADNMWDGGPAFPLHGTDLVDNDNDPMDFHGHGTHVAGTIGAAGNNGVGTTGVCWRARIMAVRVLDATGRGTTATIVQGINFAISHGAKVINMSLGGVGGFDQAFSNAVSAAQASDVVVVSAAGNEGINNDLAPTGSYPCKFSQANLICVAALDQNYALAQFSNFGPNSVDVGAPGTNILSTVNGTWSTISDRFNAGGLLNWMTSGGWTYQLLTHLGNPVDALTNPTTYPSGSYADNADQRVYKTFDLSSKAAGVLTFSLQHALQTGDALNVNYKSTGGDPFVSGVPLDTFSGTSPGGVIGPFSYDISGCVTATCAVGFQLSSNASDVAQGVAILFFSIDTLQLNNSSYAFAAGTSMATPHVSGLAAMLRAYNPRYTYVDVVNAITNAGRPVPALASTTTTGKAIDVMNSLAHINPPTGVRKIAGGT